MEIKISMIIITIICGFLIEHALQIQASSLSQRKLGNSQRPKLTTNMTFALLAWGWDTSINKEPIAGRKLVIYDFEDMNPTLSKKLQDDGHIVGCYISTGSMEPFRQDVKDNLSKWKSISVSKMDGWEEYWLDIRLEKRAILEDVMSIRLQRGKDAGCQVIEGDNVDCYQNTKCTNAMGLTESTAKPHQLSYNTWLAETSHSLNMSYILKNALGIVEELVDVMDGAMNEQCGQYKECGLLQPFIDAGKAVFRVEYSKPKRNAHCKKNLPGIVTKFCKGSPNQGLCKSGNWLNCVPPSVPLPPTEYY